MRISLLKSVIELPTRVAPPPIFRMPRSAAAVAPLSAVTARFCTPPVLSVSTIALPAAFRPTVSEAAFTALVMASSTSCRVKAPSMLTSTVAPLVSVIRKSASPAALPIPSPPLSTASDVEISSPDKLTSGASVVPIPRPPLSSRSSVCALRPLNAEASRVLPDAPPVSSASSNPEIVSTSLPVMPLPVAVSVVLVSVKLRSRDSTSVS